MRASLLATAALFVSFAPAQAEPFGAAELFWLPGDGTRDNAFGLAMYEFGPTGTLAWFGQLGASYPRDPFFSGAAARNSGDPVIGGHQELVLGNAGLTYTLGDGIGLFGGIGRSLLLEREKRLDSSNIRADDGRYYVSDGRISDWNATVGVVFAFGGSTASFGYHSALEALHLGIGLRY